MAFLGFIEAVWIRDAYSARYEKRVKPSAVGSDLPTYQKRLVRRLVRHKECDTLTTDYANWATEGLEGATATNPSVWVGTSLQDLYGTDLGWFDYSGTWDVEEVDVQDGQNGLSMVRQTLTIAGDWADIP